MTKRKPLPEINPCPFCGSDQLEVVPTLESDEWAVSCYGCMAMGPGVASPSLEPTTKRAALTLWNKRGGGP